MSVPTQEELAAEIGRQYGELTVLEHLGQSKDGRQLHLYRCLCSCGRYRCVPRTLLIRGLVRACDHCSKRSSRRSMARLARKPLGAEETAPRCRARGITWQGGALESKRSS